MQQFFLLGCWDDFLREDRMTTEEDEETKRSFDRFDEIGNFRKTLKNGTETKVQRLFQISLPRSLWAHPDPF